ncbi:MAG TPA: AAA family ATPase [Blastocatellia bacterium]
MDNKNDKDKDKKLKIVGETSPLGNEELRLWLKGHMEQYPHLTSLVLSRRDYTGVSRTALDQYVAGTYFKPVDNGGQGVDPRSSSIERKIAAYRERVDGTERHGNGNGFVKTTAWFQLQHAYEVAMEQNVIVVVYGPPGVGKTHCSLHYSVANLQTAMINIMVSRNVQPRYFAQRLAQELGLDDRAPLCRLEDMVAKKLKSAPRLISIDQANYLREQSLGTICYIWEIARVPIVLLGTRDLYDLFMSSRLTEDVRRQLSSRVAMHYPLEVLNEAECKALVHKVIGEWATDQLVADILKVTGGAFRPVDYLLPRIKKAIAKNSAKVKEGGDAFMTRLVLEAASRLMV